LEALLVSTGVIALAEVGDKTQLLALMLAARFKKPLAIISGIFCATLVNHALAGWAGVWIGTHVSEAVLRWVLGLAFIGMAAWTLVPDKINAQTTHVAGGLGVFGATLIAFFLVEMGDKTQLATVAMSVHYAQPVQVVLGTTLGMLLANAPVVYLGGKFAAKIPMRPVHAIAALIFLAFGVATLLGAGAWLRG